MHIDEKGNYHLDDGRVIPAAEVGKQFKTAPKNEKVEMKTTAPVDLAEGQSSGPIRLED